MGNSVSLVCFVFKNTFYNRPLRHKSPGILVIYGITSSFITYESFSR